MLKNVFLVGVLLCLFYTPAIAQTSDLEEPETFFPPSSQEQPLSDTQYAPSSPKTFAEKRVDSFFRAKVVDIKKTTGTINDQTYENQTIIVEALDGPKQGKTLTIDNGGSIEFHESQIYTPGETLVVIQTLVGDEETFYIHDKYRMPGLLYIILFFFALTIIFARWRGIGSVLGLTISIAILMGYILPNLVNGQSPTWITLSGTVSIVSITLYISHGFRKRTHIALLGTIITLGFAYGLSIIFVNISRMFGVGSEETFYLQYAVANTTNNAIDLKGLLLGGIIVGMLGVLDDVTMSQAATIDELKKANPSMTVRNLYQAGMSVGRDHIASMVNSLALAYVGSSLPLFLLLYLNESKTPLWVTLNSEFMAQEVVRTIAGSTAILLAVPLTTILGAYILSRSHHKSS
jgi:uncharacterized membrane protein